MAEGADGGAVLKNLPDGGAVLKALPGEGADGGPAWWRNRWRPCLVEEPMEALPGGGFLSLGRWSPTLK